MTIDMEFIGTTKYQHAAVLRNNTRRSIMLYFVNGIQIFKEKIPFDENYEQGTGKWVFTNVYLLNGKLYQTRSNDRWCNHTSTYIIKSRDVKFPLSKRILEQVNIPVDLKIIFKK